MQEDKNAIFQMRFPQKLWYLLNMNTDAILWGGTGRTILLNYRILCNYLQCDNSIFKTTNISSFVRQLNLYGFRKVTSHLQDPLCNSSNPYMHEYIHDFFQYGRPELLNKITRKTLTLKRNSKFKNIFNSADQNAFVTPLQKARRALRIALKKTAQDLFIQNSPKHIPNYLHEFEDLQHTYSYNDVADDVRDNDYHLLSDSQEDFCEEESITVDWLIPKSESNDIQKEQSLTDNIQDSNYVNGTGNKIHSYDGDKSQTSLISFSEDSCQQNVDGFPGQFLNMPDLDPEASQSSGVELLAEFNIEDENKHDIARKIDSTANDHQFLNCVLPSISNDQNDVSMAEKQSENTDHYHSEWDLMFNDIITSKGSTQECVTNFKDLYSQISQSTHL